MPMKAPKMGNFENDPNRMPNMPRPPGIYDAGKISVYFYPFVELIGMCGYSHSSFSSESDRLRYALLKTITRRILFNLLSHHRNNSRNEM